MDEFLESFLSGFTKWIFVALGILGLVALFNFPGLTFLFLGIGIAYALLTEKYGS